MITINAASLDWRTNGKGSWNVILDNLEPNTQNIGFSEGYPATVSGKKITLTNSSRPIGDLSYETVEGNAVHANTLFGIGDAKESMDVITGIGQRKFKKYIVTGDESWSTYAYNDHCWCCAAAITDSKSHGSSTVPNVICAGYKTVGIIDNTTTGDHLVSLNSTWNSANLLVFKNVDCSSILEFTTKIAGTIVYYEVADTVGLPIEEDPQVLSFEEGANVTKSCSSTGEGDYELSYDGTDYTISTKSSRKYIKTIDGVTELVTGMSSVDVRCGRDHLSDLTRMFGSTLEPGTLSDFYPGPDVERLQTAVQPGFAFELQGHGAQERGVQCHRHGRYRVHPCCHHSAVHQETAYCKHLDNWCVRRRS